MVDRSLSASPIRESGNTGSADLFGGGGGPKIPEIGGRVEPDFSGIARSPEFQDLRRKLIGFVFPMSAAFLGWYLVYVTAAAYFPQLMGVRVAGEVNIGLIMGVGQFASTILITAIYLRFARRNIDPTVTNIRRHAFGEDA